VAAALMATAAAGQAVVSDEQAAKMSLEISKAMQDNAVALREYSWTSRTEVFDGTESKKTALHLVRFDHEGKFQRTPMGGEAEKKKRGLRGRRQKKKQKKAQELTEELKDGLLPYLHPSSGELLDFLRSCIIRPGSDESAGAWIVQGTGFLREDDRVTLWVDQDRSTFRRLDAFTSVGEERISFVVTYEHLEDGPAYPSVYEVKVLSKGQTTVVETFDYNK
jgi:hypothetical protein